MRPVRTAGAGTLVEKVLLPTSGPGKKAEKIIFVGKHVVRNHFLPHIQRSPVTRAIFEFPVAVNPGEILTHFPSLFPYNEKNALLCEKAMGHDRFPFVGASVSADNFEPVTLYPSSLAKYMGKSR